MGDRLDLITRVKEGTEGINKRARKTVGWFLVALGVAVFALPFVLVGVNVLAGVLIGYLALSDVSVTAQTNTEAAVDYLLGTGAVASQEAAEKGTSIQYYGAYYGGQFVQGGVIIFTAVIAVIGFATVAYTLAMTKKPWWISALVGGGTVVACISSYGIYTQALSGLVLPWMGAGLLAGGWMLLEFSAVPFYILLVGLIGGFFFNMVMGATAERLNVLTWFGVSNWTDWWYLMWSPSEWLSGW